MATLQGMGAEITLPALELLPYSKFTDVATPIDLVRQGTDRTAFGAKWMQIGALEPVLGTYDCVSEEDMSGPAITLEEESTFGFSIFEIIRCGTIGGLDIDDLEQYVDKNMELLLSASLAWAATNSIPNVLSLSSASTDLATSPANITAAIGDIENGLADRIANARGVIMVPPVLLAPAFAAGAIVFRDGELASPRGHRVIVDAGHVGDDTIYATGVLGYSVVSRDLEGNISHFDTLSNELYNLQSAYGAVVFNSNHSVRVTLS